MQTSNKELILLVDDDPGNLKRAQTILGEEFRISATTSGKMALSLLSKVTPDLILLDVNMPEMNGFETLKKIRELENGSMIPVVFLTGDNDAETETKCFEAGAMDCREAVCFPGISQPCETNFREQTVPESFRRDGRLAGCGNDAYAG